MCFYFPLPRLIACQSGAVDAAAADGGGKGGDGEKYHTAQEGCCCLHLKRRSVRGEKSDPPFRRGHMRPDDLSQRKVGKICSLPTHISEATQERMVPFCLENCSFHEDGAKEFVRYYK